MEYQHGGDIYTQEVELDFSANTSPLGLPEGVRMALHQCLDTEVPGRYPDSQCKDLRRALGRHHQVPEQWIVCGNGAADLIFGLIHVVRPKRGLVTAPTFSEYEQAMGVCGCGTEYFYLQEENGFLPQMSLFADRILKGAEDGRRYDIVFLCNPNNPTGVPVPSERVLEAAEACARTGALLVVDECFCDFLDNPGKYSVIGELETHRTLFVLKAFTKLYSMAGLRLGYGLCSDDALMERLQAVRQPWSVSGLAQKAGEAALGERDYVERTRHTVRTGREWLRGELEGLGFTVYNSGANYLLFKTSLEKDTRDQKGWLYHSLLKRRILIRSCSNYPGLDHTFYRICVKTRAENECLIKHMKEAVREYVAGDMAGEMQARDEESGDKQNATGGAGVKQKVTEEAGVKQKVTEEAGVKQNVTEESGVQQNATGGKISWQNQL